MVAYREVVELESPGQGLHEITREIERIVERSGVREGVAQLFLLHTSASLVLSENADPSARHDLEQYFLRVAPERDPAYTHTSEGPDDMPSHIKAALTHTSETIFVQNGRLLLGTWQGIYLFEHRRRPHRRRLAVRVESDD